MESLEEELRHLETLHELQERRRQSNVSAMNLSSIEQLYPDLLESQESPESSQSSPIDNPYRPVSWDPRQRWRSTSPSPLYHWPPGDWLPQQLRYCQLPKCEDAAAVEWEPTVEDRLLQWTSERFYDEVEFVRPAEEATIPTKEEDEEEEEEEEEVTPVTPSESPTGEGEVGTREFSEFSPVTQAVVTVHEQITQQSRRRKLKAVEDPRGGDAPDSTFESVELIARGLGDLRDSAEEFDVRAERV